MSSSLQGRDAKSIWHPFTHTSLESPPIPLVRGEGAWLYGEDGRQFLDVNSSWWVNILGHGERRIAEAISQQAHKLEHAIFAGFTHEPAVGLAERILTKLPSNHERVFFSDNGSTAVEVGIKMAIQHFENKGEKRKRVICLDNSYHGDTFGAMSVSARDSFTAPFADYLFEVSFLPSPTDENIEQAEETLRALLADDKTQSLAFVFEPLVQGAGGMIMHHPASISKLIEICKEAGVVTIADEVMTGFCRTGTFFASDQLSSKPDIICMSKGITGGFLPLGATSCSGEIFESFQHSDRKRFFFHGHSYTGNPLACAAGVASFDILVTNHTQQQIASICELQRASQTELEAHPNLENFRACGTVMAIDLKTDEASGYHNSMRDTLYQFFIDRGFLFRPLGNTVYVLPPYCISNEELKSCFNVIQDAAAELKFGVSSESQPPRNC